MKKYSILKMLILSLSIALVGCSEGDIKYTRVKIEISDASITDSSLSKIIQVLTKRFQLNDVADVSIKKTNKNILEIEYPTTSNKLNLDWLIERRGLLEFSLVPDPKYTFTIMKNIDSVLAILLVSEKLLNDTISASEGSNEYSDYDAFRQIEEDKRKKEEKFKRDHPFFTIALLDPQGRSVDAYVKAEARDSIEQILKRQKVQDMIPEEVEFRFSAKTLSDKSGINYYVMYLVNKKPVLTGDVITDAVDGVDPDNSTQMVTLTMNSEGAKEWERITGSNTYKRIAIVLDGAVYTAPVVVGKITTGRSQINGLSNREEAENLAMILKSGMLPHRLKIVKEEKNNLLNR